MLQTPRRNFKFIRAKRTNNRVIFNYRRRIISEKSNEKPRARAPMPFSAPSLPKFQPHPRYQFADQTFRRRAATKADPSKRDDERCSIRCAAIRRDFWILQRATAVWFQRRCRLACRAYRACACRGGLCVRSARANIKFARIPGRGPIASPRYRARLPATFVRPSIISSERNEPPWRGSRSSGSAAKCRAQSAANPDYRRRTRL